MRGNSRWLAGFALLAIVGGGCQSKNRFMGAPPTATDPLVGDLTGTSAVVSWSTSEPMTGEVQFGPDNLYGSVAGAGGSASLQHSVAVLGLAPSTAYHFRIKNHSSGGETVYSFDRNFQTPLAGVTSPLSGKFTFDNTVQGWVAQDYIDSRAVSSVGFTAVTFAVSPGALRLNLDLRGGDAELSKGEAYVEFKNQTPFGVPMGFINLDLRPITVWIFAPTGARGDDGHPNGIQVFAKDTSGRSEYGPFVNITENSWFQVSYTPAGGGNAATAYGFDSTKIALIGIKVGVGGSSVAVYQGPLYADLVEF